jgi:Kef-type K+ transport system membrane component KefB
MEILCYFYFNTIYLVGLIVTRVGATSGVISGDVYTVIIVMVAVTTIITPIWLKKAYQKKLV